MFCLANIICFVVCTVDFVCHFRCVRYVQRRFGPHDLCPHGADGLRAMLEMGGVRSHTVAVGDSVDLRNDTL